MQSLWAAWAPPILAGHLLLSVGTVRGVLCGTVGLQLLKGALNALGLRV